MMRYDATDPKDVAVLMANGIFWMAGPTTVQGGVDMLGDGRIQPTRMIVTNVPQELVALIDRKRADAGLPTMGEAVRMHEDDGA